MKRDNALMTGKSLFESRMAQINNVSIKQALTNGEMTVADHVLYNIIDISSLSLLEGFKPSDTESPGVLNLNNGKLGVNEVFLCTGIQLLVGETATSGKEAYKVDFSAAMGANATPEYLFNGELSIKNDQKVLIEKMSTEVFRPNRTDKQKGYFKLESPKLFQAGAQIKCDIKLGAAIAAHTDMTPYVKIALIGVITVKA